MLDKFRIDTYEKFQKLESLLSGVHHEYEDDYGFYRCFEFDVSDGKAKIIWFSNMLTLIKGDLEIWFYGADVNNSFPVNGWKNSLSLKNINGDTLGAICLELT